MILVKIDATKINKDEMFIGKKGKYLDLILRENQQGRDQYGNDGFVVQGLSKASRDAGKRGEILGNWKRMDAREDKASKTQTPKLQQPASNPDDVPF